MDGRTGVGGGGFIRSSGILMGTVLFNGGNSDCHFSSPGRLTLQSKIFALASGAGGGGGSFSPSSLTLQSKIFAGAAEDVVGSAGLVVVSLLPFTTAGGSSCVGPNNVSIFARTKAVIFSFLPVTPDHGRIFLLAGFPVPMVEPRLDIGPPGAVTLSGWVSLRVGATRGRLTFDISAVTERNQLLLPCWLNGYGK